MPSKRKRSETDGAAVDDRIANSNPIRLPNVEDYPRKRISVACNLCRFRKTKCDAARPSCGFCSNLEVECQYRDSIAAERRDDLPPQKACRGNGLPSDDSLSNIEKRLKDLESKWCNLEMARLQAVMSPESLVGPAQSSPLPLNVGYNPISDERGFHLERRDSSVSTSTRPRFNFVYRQTRAEAYTARPSLLTFRSPAYVDAESWDDSADFYDSEIAAGDYFHQQLSQCIVTFPDVSKRTTRLLQQSFVENFLGWMPIFEPTAAYSIVSNACAENFDTSNPNTCLAMLILAVGSISHNHADLKSEPLPGIEYFAHGCQSLERLAFMGGNLTVLHCRILQATYFKLAIRPLQCWNTITQGARDCMHVLSSRTWQSLNASQREPWHRAFWACSIMLDELEASMKTHPIGHRPFHEVVPLPRFENEDTGFYYFLAQISLRKLVTETLDVVGYRSGKVIYAPVVTAELRNQAQEWHRHLPAAVRFPIDNTPLFDARKSFLRMQYCSLIAVLEWASVLRVMEVYGTEQELSEEITLAKTEAQECIRYSVLYLNVAEEQLLRWKLGTFISIWSTFVFLAKMIITFKAPALSYIPETHDDTHLQTALEMLRPWDHIPFVAQGIVRMSEMMERIGISIERPRPG